jgi:hypothetical protein
MRKITLNASQVHYGLATCFTLEAMVRYWLDKHVDASTAGFLIGFWGTAVANDRYNTPSPNAPSSVSS